MPSMSPLHCVVGSQVPVACHFPAEGHRTQGRGGDPPAVPAGSSRQLREGPRGSLWGSLPARPSSLRSPVSLRAWPRPWPLGTSSLESRAWEFCAVFGFALFLLGAAQVTFAAGGFPHA